MKRITSFILQIHFFRIILWPAIFIAFAALLIFYSGYASAQTPDWDFLRTMGLPWRCGDQDPRLVSQDWDDHWADYPNGGASIDFNSPGETDFNKDVLSPFGGTVTTGEADDYGKFVIINAGNGWSVRLAHLYSFVDEIDGRTISRGSIVGRSDNTGSNSKGHHIHLELYWNGGQPDKSWFRTNNNFLFSYRTQDFEPTAAVKFFSNNCGPGRTTLLYWDHNYEGYRIYFTGGGFFNVPDWFNDKASSLRIEVGHHVTLFENSTFDTNGLGGEKTFYGNDMDFADDYFNNGILVNDKVSSIEVPVPGDGNNDRKVDILDYVFLFQNYEIYTDSGPSSGDFDYSGKVDILDYVILFTYFHDY